MTTTTFQNGQVLTSNALTPDDMDAAFQQLVNQMLGVVANLEIANCNVVLNSDQVGVVLGPYNLQVGFIVQGAGISLGTTISALVPDGSNLFITLSNPASASVLTTLSFFDPLSNTRVRYTWIEKGAPGFGIDNDIMFIRCVEEPTDYNNIRDETWKPNPIDSTTMIKTRTYTRQWRVYFVSYGPNAFDSIRLVKSMLLEDFPHDTLAAINLYLLPAMPTPVRLKDLFEGQWWERVDFSAVFDEGVTETITVPNVAQVEVLGQTSTDQIFDVIAPVRS